MAFSFSSIFSAIFSLLNKTSSTPAQNSLPAQVPVQETPVPVIVPISTNSGSSRAGLALVKFYEGCKLEAYQDIVGVWTIGYGQTKGVKPGMVITQAQADEDVIATYDSFEAGVKNLLKVSVTDNQLGALTSFAYNLGLGSLAGSTLLKLLNSGSPASVVAAQFARWNQAGGKPVDGLTRRRKAEAALFLQV
jgi:lysozyme